MDLCFSDIHLGCKVHSQQLPSGFVSADEDCMYACEQILEAASKPEIDRIIICGDLSHTNRPSTLIVGLIISLIHRLNDLNKPVFLIPGNHDASTYSHAFAYLKEIKTLHNIKICDATTGVSVIESDKHKTKLYLIPFMFGTDLEDKYSTVKEAFKSVVSTIGKDEKAIIVSHFQESSSSKSSESSMISKSVESFDLDEEFKNDLGNIVCVLGHMHKHQYYSKLNGIKVIYPGNIYPIDKEDCDTNKGYIILNPETFDFEFKPLKHLRNFRHFKFKQGESICEFLSRVRLSKNSCVFISKDIATESEKESEVEIRDILASKGSLLISLSYKRVDIKEMIELSLNHAAITPDTLTQTFKKEFSDKFHQKYNEEEIECIGENMRTFLSNAQEAYRSSNPI